MLLCYSHDNLICDNLMWDLHYQCTYISYKAYMTLGESSAVFSETTVALHNYFVDSFYHCLPVWKPYLLKHNQLIKGLSKDVQPCHTH